MTRLRCKAKRVWHRLAVPAVTAWALCFVAYAVAVRPLDAPTLVRIGLAALLALLTLLLVELAVFVWKGRAK